MRSIRLWEQGHHGGSKEILKYLHNFVQEEWEI
jgi:hypothetical protein